MSAVTKANRSLQEIAQMAASVARAAKVDAVICVTQTGALYHAIRKEDPQAELIAATPARQTWERLRQTECFAIRLPVRVLNPFREARHAIAICVKEGIILPGCFVECVVGQGLPGSSGNFLVLMDVPEDAANVPLHDLICYSSSVGVHVLDAALEVSCRIARAARRGRRTGAIITVGDAKEVLVGARQLVPNPFRDQPVQERMLTNCGIWKMLLELSKLDGAFVVDRNGVIQAACVFLQAGQQEIEVPHGLGTRHVTAAAVTARTKAIAVVASAADGNIRVFSQGRLVVEIDPESPGLTD